MRRLAVILSAMLIGSVMPGAEIIPGQAVSWTDFSHISSIAIGHEFAYFGTTDGILRYNRIEQKWHDPITASDGLPRSPITRLAVSMDDREIAVETEAGIYSYDNGMEAWFLETEFPIENYRDSRPRPPLPRPFMPFGYQITPEGYIEDQYFRRFQITAWLDDNFSSIFFGTWGLGTGQVNDQSFDAVFLPCGLLQKRTDAIYMDGDSLWLAGNAGDRPPQYANARLGVTLFDINAGIFTHFEPRYLDGFGSEVIYDIAGDNKNVYFAGRQGLTVLVRNENRFFTLGRGSGLPETETTALAVGTDSVWVGTTRGLALYTPSVDTIVTVGRQLLGSLFITDLELVSGRLIIGTSRGAYYIDLTSKKIGRLKDPDGQLRGVVHHVCASRDELFVSTDWGLSQVNLKTEKARPVPYLSTRPVYAAAANDKYIAAAVDDGLMLIERGVDKQRLFTEDDGLLSVNINALVPDGDYLWIGSEEGLTRFKWVNPDRVD